MAILAVAAVVCQLFGCDILGRFGPRFLAWIRKSVVLKMRDFNFHDAKKKKKTFYFILMGFSTATDYSTYQVGGELSIIIVLAIRTRHGILN